MTSVLFALLVVSSPDIVDDRLRQFTKDFKAASSIDERIAAIDALSRVRDARAAKKLAQIAGLPFPTEIRVAAADAVGRIGDPKVGPVLQGVLMRHQKLFASENPKDMGDQEVVEAIVRAIGDCRDRTATTRLIPILRKNNIPLMAETCRTLGKLKDPRCLDQLLRLHFAAWSPEGVGATNPRKPLKQDTLDAVRAITGKHTLNTTAEFRAWLRSRGGRFTPPPDVVPPGLPNTSSWAIYSGKGELAALERFDLVLLDPSNYRKGDLATIRAIALSGDPKKALDMGFIGFVVTPDEASAMRQKYPLALLVSRGGAEKAGPHVNAILVKDLDPKKPDKKLVTSLKAQKTANETETLALFIGADPTAATEFAEKEGFLPYLSPDGKHAKIAAESSR